MVGLCCFSKWTSPLLCYISTNYGYFCFGFALCGFPKFSDLCWQKLGLWRCNRMVYSTRSRMEEYIVWLLLSCTNVVRPVLLWTMGNNFMTIVMSADEDSVLQSLQSLSPVNQEPMQPSTAHTWPFLNIALWAVNFLVLNIMLNWHRGQRVFILVYPHTDVCSHRLLSEYIVLLGWDLKPQLLQFKCRCLTNYM